MKIEFTNEEIYEAYSEAIIECLVFELKVEQSVAEEVLIAARLKQDFLNNPQKYDLLEPYWVAKTLNEVHLKSS